MTKKYTLDTLAKHYKPLSITLLYGDHTVYIDTRLKGSFALYRAFRDIKFYYRSFDDSTKNLVLDYVGN